MNSKNNNLFDDSEESDKDVRFSTNADYAKSYNKFRQKELLKKYKDRGIDVSSSGSSSESESTDEDEVNNSKFDQEFFKTLSSLKSKDPTIYDKNTRFFDGLELEVGQRKKQTANKPVTLKDFERKVILENEGKFVDDSENEYEGDEENARAASPTYVEEQRKLKAEFKKVLNEDNSDEEEFGGIFKKRVKSKEEKDKEEADFTKWLAGKKEDVEEEVKKSLGHLKNYWSNTKLPQREKFLRDYILNQGYAETNFADIPTYEEIVGEDENLSDDEVELEKQEEFEHKYNFRFEEPDSEFIKRYPRTIEQSVRKQDDKRKQKRQEIKERKDQEKQQKMQELEMVKAMKRKEIEEKIQKLKEVTGNDELGFKDEELEEEFDPEEHDRRMQEMFNDDYYQVEEDEDKPECPDIDELKVEDWDNYDPNKDDDYGNYDPHCEDEDFNMDCDYDPNAKEAMQQELIENSREKRKKRKRNRFAEVIKAPKPVFDPEDEKTYGEYIDEYYKLDCEDMIGDVPCRFKYTETVPNDFGLTITEILLAKNKELNQWASLKKAVQIRPEHVEKKEQKLYKLKANNEFLKRKIFKSLYGEGSEDEDESEGEGELENQPSTSAQTKRKAIETITTSNEKISKVDKESETEVPTTREDSLAEEESKTEKDNSLTTKGEKKKKKKKKNKNKATTLSQTDIQKPTTTSKSGSKSSKQLVAVKAKNLVVNPFKRNGIAGSKPFNKAIGTNQKNFNKINFKHNKAVDNGTSSQITDDRLKAYGINPRKFHKKQKYGNKTT